MADLKLAKSPWMLHYDGSSCNGCDIEVLACTTPNMTSSGLASSIPVIRSRRIFY